MHPTRLVGKGIKEAHTAAKPLPDLLRLADPAITPALLLAGVGQAVAMSASEELAAGVEFGDPSPAIAPLHRRRGGNGGPDDGRAVMDFLADIERLAGGAA